MRFRKKIQATCAYNKEALNSDNNSNEAVEELTKFLTVSKPHAMFRRLLLNLFCPF